MMIDASEGAELGPGLDAQQQALARSRLYGLLARLLVRGVDEHWLAQVQGLGWLPAEGDAPLDLDALAAEHHAMFSLGVFPYAGAFLTSSAAAGGFADEVRQHYAKLGFEPRLDELSADHLGVELSFLAFATGAQADALEDGRPQIAASLDAPLAEFIDACVLAWLPAFVTAVEALARGSKSFWARVVRAALEVVAEHRATLPGPIAATATLSDPGDLLADERTGLRRIVEHLLTPVASGLLLTREDIAQLGRARELPRGFGSRVLMLDNLLRSAVEYHEVGPLLASLDELLGQRDHALAALADELQLSAAVGPWRAAITRTRALLDRISASAATLQVNPERPPSEDPPWTSKPSTTTPPAP